MALKWVEKNNGHIEKFNKSKLAKSIYFSMHHIGKGSKELAHELASEVPVFLSESGVVASSKIREAVLHILRSRDLKEEASSYELTSLHMVGVGIKEVRKRDGGLQEFHPNKIFKSVRRACLDAGIIGGKLSEEITKEVIRKLSLEHKDGQVSTHTIKKAVAHALKDAGFEAVERKYLIHRYV